MRYATLLTPIAFLVMSVPALAKADSKLIHDAEYYLSEAQNAEKWAADDKAVEVKLAQIVQTNGGKRPNIVYILLDDLGFGGTGPASITSKPSTLVGEMISSN